MALAAVTPASADPWMIYVVQRSGAVQRLSTDGVYDMAPSWAPDGSKIAFLSRPFPDPLRGGGDDIWVMRADGTARVRLTLSGDLASPGFPAWSPTGEWIAFSWHDVSTANYQTGIFVMKQNGTQVTRVIPDTIRAAELQRPTWSPDGNRLAFVTGNGRAIGMVDVDGSDLSVVPIPMWVESLAWSPDGAFLAFNDNCPPNEDCSPVVWLFRIADGSLIRVGFGFSPAWAH